MPNRNVPEHRQRAVSTKEEIAILVQRSRSDRYIRTAHFVQSKWFMIVGAAAIAVFLTVTFLVSR